LTNSSQGTIFNASDADEGTERLESRLARLEREVVKLKHDKLESERKIKSLKRTVRSLAEQVACQQVDDGEAEDTGNKSRKRKIVDESDSGTRVPKKVKVSFELSWSGCKWSTEGEDEEDE
jgi:hypothetical protein